MLLSELGEFGLIKKFKQAIKLDASVIKGTGDDCAVLKFDKLHYLLFTCDMLVEGLDFLKKDDPFLIGRKAIAVSISDIAACAGVPRYCLVSLGLPKKTSLKFVERLFKGMRNIAKTYTINIVGGDLSRAERIVIDVSMLGRVEKEKLVLRSRAKKGDIIFVTCSLGGSIRGKHLRFTPRLKEARFLTGNFKINSMLDISDGLVQDLSHILEESKVGALIYEDLVPINKGSTLDEALSGGEDFELLFTLGRKQARKLQLKSNFKAIGEIMDKRYGLRLIDRRGRERKIKAQGFRHF